MSATDRQVRDRFRLLMDTLPHGVQECDANGIITFANTAHAVMHGYSDGETIGMAIWDMHGDERDKQELRDYLAYLVREQPPATPYVGRDQRKDGRQIDVQVDWAYQRDEEGRVTGFISVVTDVSERVKAERELVIVRDAAAQRAAEMARVLIEASPNTIVLMERDGVVVATNQAFAERMGCEVDDLLGNNIFDRLAPEAAKRRRAMIEQVLRTGKAAYLEDERAGQSLESWIHPVFDREGKVERLLVYAIDVSNRKRREAELVAKEAELQQARRLEAIGRLAAGVAHDFNNVLQVISSCASLTLRVLDAGTSPGTNLKEILLAVDRAAELVRQLLTFGGKHTVKAEVVDLNQVIMNLENMLRSTIGEHIELTIGRSPDPANVCLGSSQIEQVLLNIVINARDAMPQVGKLSIEIGAAQGADDMVEVTISDTGTGMDDETRSRVFEPFFTTKPEGKGTGLGLSTAFGIVTRWGGDLSVESVLGQGSSFRIRVPRARGESKPNEPAARAESPHSAWGLGTILLVEDDSALRTITSLLLRDSGFEVLSAQGAEEALRLCAEAVKKPTVLVTDVVMPKMRGPELAKRIREQIPGIHALFLSGHSEEAIGGGSGLDGLFLAKPYEPDQLVTLVKQLLNADS